MKHKKDKRTQEEKDMDELYSTVTKDMIKDFKEDYNSKYNFMMLDNNSAEILLKAKLRKEYIMNKNKEGL